MLAGSGKSAPASYEQECADEGEYCENYGEGQAYPKSGKMKLSGMKMSSEMDNQMAKAESGEQNRNSA